MDGSWAYLARLHLADEDVGVQFATQKILWHPLDPHLLMIIYTNGLIQTASIRPTTGNDDGPVSNSSRQAYS